MAIFDRFRKKTDAKPASTKDDKATSKELEAVKKITTTDGDVVGKKALTGSELSFSILRRPHVSEKAARGTEKGVYVFDVKIDAEKVSIKKAVEALYKVKVVAVRTIRHQGKPSFRGRRPGARNAWKKAIVTLAKDQRIRSEEHTSELQSLV